jgi:hypothetical protein
MKLTSFVFGKALVARTIVYVQLPQYLGEWVKAAILDSEGVVCPSKSGHCSGTGLSHRVNTVDTGAGGVRACDSYYCEGCNSFFMVMGDMFFGSGSYL